MPWGGQVKHRSRMIAPGLPNRGTSKTLPETSAGVPGRGRASAAGQPLDGERTIGIPLILPVVVAVAFDARRASPPGVSVTLPAGGDGREQHVGRPDALRRLAMAFGAGEGTMGSVVEPAMGQPTRRDAGRNHGGKFLTASVPEG